MHQEIRKRMKMVFHTNVNEKETLFNLSNELTKLHKILETIKRERAKFEYNDKEVLMIDNIAKTVTYKIKKISSFGDRIRNFISKKTKQIKVYQDDDYDQGMEFAGILNEKNQHTYYEEQKEIERQELERLTESIYELNQFFLRMSEIVFEHGELIRNHC